MSLGINLRVTGHSNQGGRKYMEDYFSVAYQSSQIEKKDVEYAYFGIFDGHGGCEAAKFAKDHLLREIVNNKLFWSKYDSDVLRAIREGYISTHYAMWREQEKWPKTATGLPSTAGTTASVAFIFRKKIYIGHVGDSGIVLGYQEEGEKCWKAKPLTNDHKPECSVEKARIINSGGKVVTKSGVPRVVWNRPRIGHKGPVRRSTPFDEIPFLAVARSLGDLWSYNSALNQFIVSPDPDVRVVKIDSKTFRCLIFGTDGLWNVVTPDQAVDMARDAEIVNERLFYMGGNSSEWTNPSKYLVEKALERWHVRRMRADNTSVITVFLDQPGKPKKQFNNGNGIIDRCSNTTRYEVKYEMDNEFSPEHVIYNGFNETNQNDMLSSCHIENHQDLYYEHYQSGNQIIETPMYEKDHLFHTSRHMVQSNNSDCYSMNALQYSPLTNHGVTNFSEINDYKLSTNHYNASCDTNYTYFDNSIHLDNSSSSYKYDNVPECAEVITDQIDSYTIQSNMIVSPVTPVPSFESSFDLTHQLDESMIAEHQQSNTNTVDPLSLDNQHQIQSHHTNEMELHNDSSNYSHSFAESYNSLLISSLENENSSSSGSSSSSSSSSSSCGSDISGDDELFDSSRHTYKSLNETGLAGHDHVFHHSPNTSNEEQQQQYQEACMQDEEGYSLTKLETRVEQRLRNNNNIETTNSNDNQYLYPEQQSHSSHYPQNNHIETFQTFTELGSYDQYNSITSSYSSTNNNNNNNNDKHKSSHNDTVKENQTSNKIICDKEMPIQSNPLSFLETNIESVESSDDIENNTIIKMETEIFDEEIVSIKNKSEIEKIDNIIDKEITSSNYVLEESIQINEISSSNIEVNSPMPSPSSSNNKYIIEKLIIEPVNVKDIESSAETKDRINNNLVENKLKADNVNKIKNNIKTSLRNNISNKLTDKQKENENLDIANTRNCIRRSLRSTNNNGNINDKSNNTRSNNNSKINNINNNFSLSKDMKAKKIINKNKPIQINGNLTKTIVRKEILKIVNTTAIENNNNNIIMAKLRSRPNNINNNNNNSCNKNSNIDCNKSNNYKLQSSVSENLAKTQKVTVWSKKSRRTIQTNVNTNSTSPKLNQKLNKTFCTNSSLDFNKNICHNNDNLTSIISSTTNNIGNCNFNTKFKKINCKLNYSYAQQKLQTSTLSSVSSTTSMSSTPFLSSKKNSTNFISTKRSSTSRNSAWCPNKKSVQTRNRVQKR